MCVWSFVSNFKNLSLKEKQGFKVRNTAFGLFTSTPKKPNLRTDDSISDREESVIGNDDTTEAIDEQETVETLTAKESTDEKSVSNEATEVVMKSSEKIVVVEVGQEKCCVPTCENPSDDFHKFPEDPRIQSAWVAGTFDKIFCSIF